MEQYPTIEEFRAANSSLTKEAFASKHRDPFLVIEMKIYKQDARDFKTLASTSAERPTEMESKDEIGRTAPQVAVLAKSKRNSFHNMITLGRADNNDIPVRQGSISKFHAFFRKDPASGELSVFEAGSRFGTTLNGAAIKQGDGKPVASGDTIVLARSVSVTFFSPPDLYDYMRLVKKTSGG